MGECISKKTPPESSNAYKIEKQLQQYKKCDNKRIKILLLGPGESGKSTIFKQMKIIQFKGGFSLEEIMAFIHVIHANCLSQMKLLITALQESKIPLAEEESSVGLQLMNYENFCPEVAELIKIMWNDKAIKNLVKNKPQLLHLNESATYFFDQIERISKADYVPTLDDILRARLRSNGVEEAEFVFEDLTINMIDVGGQRSERRKWLHCFDHVDVILFVASLSCYDQNLREDINQNAMIETFLLFQEVTNSEYWHNSDTILFLNKKDLFEQKISRVPLSEYFPEYDGGNDLQKAVDYIRQKFIKLSNSNTLYIHSTCALDTNNIKLVIQDIRISILQRLLSDGFIK